MPECVDQQRSRFFVLKHSPTTAHCTTQGNSTNDRRKSERSLLPALSAYRCYSEKFVGVVMDELDVLEEGRHRRCTAQVSRKSAKLGSPSKVSIARDLHWLPEYSGSRRERARAPVIKATHTQHYRGAVIGVDAWIGVEFVA